MLIDTTGDLLLSRASVLVHGVAPNDPFHSGLALQLRERFPAMYKDFRHYCQSTHAKAGSLWAWSGIGPDGPIRLLALLTQEGGYEHGAKPGRATLHNVGHALKALRLWIDTNHPASLALPKLATGLGGLEWTDVHPLVQQHLGTLSMPVYLYSTYQKGIRGGEPLSRTGAATV